MITVQAQNWKVWLYFKQNLEFTTSWQKKNCQLGFSSKIEVPQLGSARLGYFTARAHSSRKNPARTHHYNNFVTLLYVHKQLCKYAGPLDQIYEICNCQDQAPLPNICLSFPKRIHSFIYSTLTGKKCFCIFVIVCQNDDRYGNLGCQVSRRYSTQWEELPQSVSDFIFSKHCG